MVTKLKGIVMYLNKFNVMVCEPDEVAILVGMIQKSSTVALQAATKPGAEVIIKAWNDALLMLVDDVNTHFDTSNEKNVKPINRELAIEILLREQMELAASDRDVILDAFRNGIVGYEKLTDDQLLTELDTVKCDSEFWRRS